MLISYRRYMGPAMRSCVTKSGVGEIITDNITIERIAQRLFFANVLGDKIPMRIKINKIIGS